uniref:Uncharacterized protein n=1 Tax=Aegilops tauschii subsp. strangulata TaxID=200361 RepID=A0A453HRC5_AEGTS
MELVDLCSATPASLFLVSQACLGAFFIYWHSVSSDNDGGDFDSKHWKSCMWCSLI